MMSRRFFRHGAPGSLRGVPRVVWALTALITPWCLGQSGTPTAEPPKDGGASVKTSELPPPLKLGLRADLMRRQRPVVPTVVIVPNVGLYVEAIARWTPAAYYPVLIDDGSRESREDIARFVRGFEPEKVVRWSSADGVKPWPGTLDDQRATVNRALNRSWGATPDVPWTDLRDHWKTMGVTPPGVVVASLDDGAWTAALALAAGHAQPILWVKGTNAPHAVWTAAEIDTYDTQIQTHLKGLGLAWEGLGDDVDALTVCAAIPVKYAPPVGFLPGGGLPAFKPGENAATTDRLGRLGGSSEASARWAWASQIFGNESRAAYRAMCSLFLQPKTAWLFDGYEGGVPWSQFDATEAGKVLEQAGVHAVVDDSPRNGRSEWRARSAKPLDAGLVFVNTMGNVDFFDLKPGRGRAGDTPILLVPSVVHMVHSWSAQFPAERGTVGGKWLDHGAYAYYGSVHEPFLGAFQPTPGAAGRIVSGAAWGAAPRIDKFPVWRLACFGDALMTVGPAPKRIDGPLGTPEISNASNLEDDMRAAVKAGKFANAMTALALLGRDNDAGRLAASLIQDKPADFTPAVAAVSVLPLFRSGRTALVGRAFAAMDEKSRLDERLRDGLWAAACAELAITNDKDLLELLSNNLRKNQPATDAGDLAPAYVRVIGKVEAAAMLERVKQGLTDQNQIKELDAALLPLK